MFQGFRGAENTSGTTKVFPAPLRFEERERRPVSGEPNFARHKTHPVGQEVFFRFIQKRTGVSVRLILL